MSILNFIVSAGVASLKVMLGAAWAVGFGGSVWEIFLSTSIGAMAGVLFFSLMGIRIREWSRLRRINRKNKKPKKINFKRNRRLLSIWHKYGIYGVAFLTPPFITPPIGALISVRFGEKLPKILLYMSISVAFWCFLFALFADFIVAVFH